MLRWVQKKMAAKKGDSAQAGWGTPAAQCLCLKTRQTLFMRAYSLGLPQYRPSRSCRRASKALLALGPLRLCSYCASHWNSVPSHSPCWLLLFLLRHAAPGALLQKAAWDQMSSAILPVPPHPPRKALRAVPLLTSGCFCAPSPSRWRPHHFCGQARRLAWDSASGIFLHPLIHE